MANIQTVQRIDVTMQLEAEEAKALVEHLQQTTNEQTNNLVLSVTQSLANAVNPPQRKPRDPNAPKQTRKTAEQKAAEAAQVAANQPKATTQAPSAPANTQAPKANGQTAAPAVQKKVTVPA